MVDGLLAVNPEPGPCSGSAAAGVVDELRSAAIAHLLANDVASAHQRPLRVAPVGSTRRLAA